MLRRGTKLLLRAAISTYFERIRVHGVRNVRKGTAAIYAGNHPSGLIDPLVLMAALPHEEITSVAKSSVFDMPVIGFFVKQMRAVPVAKPFDPNLPEAQQPTVEERRLMNRKMFDSARQRLVDENCNIAIFPEGTCHTSHEIKELKTGTARIALEVAAARPSRREDRIPIIPVGLSYSQPSGTVFRGSVLVDFGRPVEVDDGLLERYVSGGEAGQREACEELTRRLEKHLRNVTIAVPDWREELAALCEREGWAPPVYSAAWAPRKRASEKPTSVLSTVEANSCAFISDTKTLRRSEIGRIRSQHKGEGDPPAKLDVDLARQAARRAFFELSGAEGYDVFGDSEDDFVEGIHLARRIYKPEMVPMTLAQRVYAQLTRNFMYGFLRTGALRDPEFRKLWRDVLLYRDRLSALDLTDRYVAIHAIGSDPTRRRLGLLRRKAAQDALLGIVLAPVSALGTALHLPVATVATLATRRFGVDDDGDRSVEATVALLAGFLSSVIWYGTVGCGAAAAAALGVGGSGLSSGSAAAAALSVMGVTGATAIKYPALRTSRRVGGAIKLLSSDHNVDGLRKTRAELKERLRKLVDRHAPEDQKGWWRGPKHEVFVTAEDLETSGAMPCGSGAHQVALTIRLDPAGVRAPGERAALTPFQKRLEPGEDASSRTALLWIPGRNDSFYHVHLLPRLLEEANCDVFALDLRRCGRAKESESGASSAVALSDPLLAHDTFDFEEYCEEIGEALRFVRDISPLPADGIVNHGGCGRSYGSVVIVAHSTGALAALTHARVREACDGYIFNSPFFSWNLPWYQELVCRYPKAFSPVIATAMSGGIGGNASDFFSYDPATPLSQGGQPSDYSLLQRTSYEFPELLKSTTELTVTAGWAKAVSHVHGELRRGELALKVPTLCLYTDADTVLDSVQIDRACDHLSDPQRKDGSNTSLRDPGLVERRIGSDEWHRSAHDVFAAPSQRRVDEAMDITIEWLGHHFQRRQ